MLYSIKVLVLVLHILILSQDKVGSDLILVVKTVVFCVEYKGKAGNWAEYEGKRMDDGEWHHYVCVYQKVDGKRDSYLYIDGEKVIEKKGVIDKVVDNWPYYIGCNYRFTNGAFAPENFLNGYLDDFILYERILSESEIKELYNN